MKDCIICNIWNLVFIRTHKKRLSKVFKKTTAIFTKMLKKIKNIQPKLIGVGPRSVVVELTHTFTEKKNENST